MEIQKMIRQEFDAFRATLMSDIDQKIHLKVKEAIKDEFLSKMDENTNKIIDKLTETNNKNTSRMDENTNKIIDKLTETNNKNTDKIINKLTETNNKNTDKIIDKLTETNNKNTDRILEAMATGDNQTHELLSNIAGILKSIDSKTK